MPATSTLGDCYRLARSNGLSHEQAIIAAAIAMAESGLDQNAVGDTALVDRTWGPSIGLWQIRTLKSAPNGSVRDAGQLKNPVANAHSMAEISNGGTNWTPWTTYTNGAYRAFLADARAAAAKGPEVRYMAPPPAGGSSTVPAGLGGSSTSWRDPADALGDVVKGQVTEGLRETALTGIVYAAAFGLAVALIGIGAWRAVA